MPNTTTYRTPDSEKKVNLSLAIPFLNKNPTGNLTNFSAMLDSLPRHPILNNSWPAYVTKCQAWFSMAYSPEAFLIKYFVRDDFFNSVNRAINGPVHQDNCVEFFIRFDNDTAYYNIEFNCLGCGKVGYGTNNQNRQYLSEAYVREINTWKKLSPHPDGFDWEMLLMIPASTFEFHEIVLNKHLKCFGNFYKCGDALPNPHFLTWAKIEAAHPNFHRPDAFQPINLTGITLT